MADCPPDRVCDLVPGTVYAVCPRCRTRRVTRRCPECGGAGVVAVGREADVRAGLAVLAAVRQAIPDHRG